MKAYVYFSLLSSVLVSGSVYAACTPAPDCASLGYTATSCPDGGVKCPWDTTLWHCDEDDCVKNGFKYSCTGAGYSGGVGIVCNNKFMSCNCASVYEWNNGSCQKKKSYSFDCCDYYCGGYSGCLDHYSSCDSKKASCRRQGGTPQSGFCMGPSYGANDIDYTYEVYYCRF